jgi:hypothetical protein
VTTARALAQHVATALGISLVLVGGFSAFGHPTRPAWFAAAALAGGIGSVAVRILGQQLIQSSWPEKQHGYVARWRNNDSRAQFLATWLQESHRDPATFSRRVQPLLAELVAARLRRRYGIDLTAPEARAVLGDDVWDLVTTTEPRVVSQAEIERAVRIIENL